MTTWEINITIEFLVDIFNRGKIYMGTPPNLEIPEKDYSKIKQGDELIITKNEDAIVIKKVKKEDFGYLLKHSERVAKELWDNKDDGAWDNV